MKRQKQWQNFYIGLACCTLLTLNCCSGSDNENHEIDQCLGTQEDYDQAYESCFQDGQEDFCSGQSQGASYFPDDLCNDGLGDKSTQGCEAGYVAGFESGCPQ